MGLAWFLAKRGIFLTITLVLAILTTVIIANGFGKIDDLLKAQIQNDLRQRFNNDPSYRRLDPQEQNRVFNETYNRTVEARGLNRPFPAKVLGYTMDALLLRLGRSQVLTSTSGSHDVATIIGERLPRTLILFTSANILAAAVGIFLGLHMARKALSVFDRGMTGLSVTTFVVPSWVFGIFFILIFGFGLRILPTGGSSSVPAYPEGTPTFYLDTVYHMILPVFTIAFSVFGQWSYTTRNLVLQIMEEDFVKAARARGLAENTILRRYVLRTASPPIVTSLALTMVTAWTGAIITETVFNYPGLGYLFFQAITVFDAPVIISLTAIYAELLVATVFVLELVYSLLDPRIRSLRR